jgi:hypothetical protein
MRPSVAEGVTAPEQPPELLEHMEDFVERASPLLRSALHSLLGASKSAVISLALLHRRLSVVQAVEASRVDEEFQIRENGFVEDGHDVARAETRVRLASAAACLWLAPQPLPARDELGAVRARNRVRRLWEIVETIAREEMRARLEAQFSVDEHGLPLPEEADDFVNAPIDPSLSAADQQLVRDLRQKYRALTRYPGEDKGDGAAGGAGGGGGAGVAGVGGTPEAKRKE